MSERKTDRITDKDITGMAVAMLSAEYVGTHPDMAKALVRDMAFILADHMTKTELELMRLDLLRALGRSPEVTP
jgi:hypothetical protein